MSLVRASVRAVHRLLTDDNFDLWLLTAAAGVFTVLGIVDVASMSVLSSAILALLAALAVAQIRSRRLVAEIADRTEPADVLLRDFPEDLVRRRAEADDVLLIGIAMARTVQGARDDFHRALTRGARIRVLVVDPTDHHLVEQAALLRPAGRQPCWRSGSGRRWTNWPSSRTVRKAIWRSGSRSSSRRSA
ncbi:hypothetical protein ACQPXM_05115 [Kribbella sp. CA-253562]|uniref:hypothetical protein n=1 Tax=Kribbella sp. CA-253562 TaxID=3239942 RepID=UPI003D946D67